MRCDSTIVDVMWVRLNIAISFEKEYNERFLATRVVKTVKGNIRFDFLTRNSVRSFRRDMGVAEISLRHKSVPSLLETLNGDDAGSNRPGISYLDDNGLFSVTAEKLPVLFGAACNFEKYPNRPAPFHAATLYASKIMFPAHLRVVSVGQHAEFASEFS